MSSRRKSIPPDSLLQLRQRLDRLPPKSPERAVQIATVAQLYGVSATTVYRSLHRTLRPRTAHRRDHGRPRVMSRPDLEYYCELIAALKLRTTNKAGRHLSTGRAIQLLEEYGVETQQGLVRAPAGVLSVPTVNRWLSLYRLDQPRLLREPPATRFQAEYSNDCWQFDMSPSNIRSPARFRCTNTGRSARGRQQSALTVSMPWPRNWACPSVLSPGVISGWSAKPRRLSMNCPISLLFPRSLNTSTPR